MIRVSGLVRLAFQDNRKVIPLRPLRTFATTSLASPDTAVCSGAGPAAKVLLHRTLQSGPDTEESDIQPLKCP